MYRIKNKTTTRKQDKQLEAVIHDMCVIFLKPHDDSVMKMFEPLWFAVPACDKKEMLGFS